MDVRHAFRRTGYGVLGLLTIMAGSLVARAEMAAPGQARDREAPIRTTMNELHTHGGVPPGWTFRLPAGDVMDGRKVFIAMECFACHAVQGETFPGTAKTPPSNGPALTGMGSHHPAEYFAESIVNPNRVIVEGPGYMGPDGLSKMPSYADTMTVKQLADVVAYITSLRGADDMRDGHGTMKHSGTHGGSMEMK